MSEFALEIRDLVRYYGNLLAVDHLSLQVRRGEVFGFLGPNGAGKTTSIHMMCGLLKPNSGEVFINGEKIQSSSGSKIRSRVGVCPQSIIIWSKLTCFEQLVFVARMYDVPGKIARKRADSLLDRMGLREKRNKLASTLSGGMKRRMNVILAIVHDPDIVVFDEPEAGLDPQSRIMVREFIQETAQEKTVIFTTHNMDEAERVAERVAIIDSGKLLKLDTPENLKKSIGEGDILELHLSTADETALNSAAAQISKMNLEVKQEGSGLHIRSMDLIPRIHDIYRNTGQRKNYCQRDENEREQPGGCVYTFNGKEAEAMRWYYVFTKSVREQLRDYWILVLVVILAPFMLFMYYLMLETEKPSYKIIFVNQDEGTFFFNQPVNLGDSLIYYLKLSAKEDDLSFLHFREGTLREEAEKMLKSGDVDVLIVLPENLTSSLLSGQSPDSARASFEIMGDVTDMNYLVGAVWTEEIINRFVQEATRVKPPIEWKETTIGFSGQRTEYELYVPGLLILSIIMMMFSASAAIVREPETKTLERLKISKLSALEFLSGLSLLQIILAVISLVFALLTAVAIGYTLIPGTLWFIFLIGFLTALSMISFSLIVAATCRSIKDVAIIGTFPLFLLMFFSGAAYPLSGGKLFNIGKLTLHINDILSPTWAVDALNKVLVKGMAPKETITEMIALVILTLLYFVIGVWAFRRRHMRAG